jgi:hypothetical protein
MFAVRIGGVSPDQEFTCAQALVDFLSKQQNNHLSVFRKSDHGLKRVFYVSVNDSGEVSETYSGQKRITKEYFLS